MTILKFGYAAHCRLLGLASLIGLTGVGAQTATTPPPASPVQPPVSTPPAQPRYDVNFRPGNFSQLSAWDLQRLREELELREGAPMRISVPLRAPPLGRPLPPPLPGEADEAVARLRPYLAEPFFSPLSALLQTDQLSTRRAAMLERYGAQKREVVKALGDELGRLQTATPEERRRRLAVFAQTQAAAVAQVEEQAEALRQELCRARPLAESVDWERVRSRLPAESGGELEEKDRFELLEMTAAFEREFSIEQRGLLREAAGAALDGARSERAPAEYLDFLPGTARVRLPESLPEPLGSRIEAFRRLKTQLRDELCAMVFTRLRSNEQARTTAFQELRTRQAAGIAELESLAEEIRIGLVGLPLPDEPAKPVLPAVLAPRIAEYLQAKVETQRAFVAKLAEVRAAAPRAQAEIAECAGGYEIRLGAEAEAPLPVARALALFNDEQLRRYAELLALKRSLVQAIRAGAPAVLAETDRPVDALLQDFAAVQRQRENWDKYWAYRQAVLEPGLSPGQRRLLFSSAVATIVAPYVR